MKFTTSSGLRGATCVLAAMSIAACASSPAPIIGPAVGAPRADLGQAGYQVARSTTYLIRPADEISVNVFREPDFSMPSVKVGVEGNVSLPMVGSIRAAGMTAAQFEQEVTRRLGAAGLRTPQVSVNITQYASHLVTVEGAVESPGVFAFQPGSRLSAAVAQSGGLSRVAKADTVAVFREGPEGIMIARFDYAQVSQGTMLDPVLEPGDRVVVGTNGLSVFYRDLLQALPVAGIFATVAAR